MRNREQEGYEIPYADPVTRDVDLYVRSRDDFMKQRIRLRNRATDPVTGEIRSEFLIRQAEMVETSEEALTKKIAEMIKEHPMADWLEGSKTMGARVGTVLGRIRNPHRFPGQKCSEGCYLLPHFDPGTPCPVVSVPSTDDADPEPCPGVVQAPRRGTGCRAVWKYAGLAPYEDEEGNVRLSKYRKGYQGEHSGEMKTAILMPQGVGQQFYMQGSRYAETYYAEKERLKARDRDDPEREERAPGWYDATARVIAAKEWLGDLLTEWKSRVDLDRFEREWRESAGGVLTPA